MPIRINLKELFPSDSQEIYADKTNYNFNKLLELGIGERGLRGLLGGLGGLGPVGIDGPQGDRGATWFVDTGADPNLLTFPIDLVEGDMYMDSNTLSIWQYDGTAWVFVADISNIINNYLLASPSPFIRGFGIGSPTDNRYILFNNRDDVGDTTLGIQGNTSTNDILLLNNWDEDVLNLVLGDFPNPPEFGGVPPSIPTSDMYNSVLAISLDQRTNPSLGKYHIEFGSVYEEFALSKTEMSKVYENFKGKFTKIVNSIHPGIEYNTEMLFSLDLPDTILASNRVSNGVFKFLTPKFIPTGLNTSSQTFIGSRYGIDEIAGVTELTKIDGIAFSDGGTSMGTIGMSVGNSINQGNFPANGGYIEYNIADSYFMLEPLLSAKSIYLNYETWQDKGNLIQLGTGTPREKEIAVADKGAPNTSRYSKHMGIAVLGDDVYTVNGNEAVKTGAYLSDLDGNYGYMNRFSIENPNIPISGLEQVGAIQYSRFDGKTGNATSVATLACNSLLNYNQRPIGSGICDVDGAGEYIYVVNEQDRELTGRTTYFDQTYFQVLKRKSHNDIGFKKIAAFGWDGTAGVLDTDVLINAYRVKLHGNHAIVATCGLHGQTLGYKLNTTNYEGQLTAIDISDPENPAIIASKTADKQLVGAAPRNAIMDIDIVDDFIVALNWEQNCSATPGANTVQIDVKVFDARGLKDATKSIDYIGKSANTLLTTVPANDAANLSLIRRGAISANRKTIFAGYGYKIAAYDFVKSAKSGTHPDCYFDYAQANINTTTLKVGDEIVDLEQIGNSLYALVLTGGGTQTLVYKFDISEVHTGGSIRYISKKTLQYSATDRVGSRFKIIGKHIYVAVQNTIGSEDDVPALLAVDFDGFYTGCAHIESLRTEQFAVTKDVKIGGDTKLNGSANIGGNTQIDGSLAVGQDIIAPQFSSITATVPSTVLLVGAPSQLLNISAASGDSHGEIDTVADTFTAKFSGKYLITFNILSAMAAGAASLTDYATFTSSIKKNGLTSIYSNGDTYIQLGSVPMYKSINASAVIELSTGDYIEFWFSITTTHRFELAGEISIHRIV